MYLKVLYFIIHSNAEICIGFLSIILYLGIFDELDFLRAYVDVHSNEKVIRVKC
jgi:hypothetical protein